MQQVGPDKTKKLREKAAEMSIRIAVERLTEDTKRKSNLESAETFKDICNVCNEKGFLFYSKAKEGLKKLLDDPDFRITLNRCSDKFKEGFEMNEEQLNELFSKKNKNAISSAQKSKNCSKLDMGYNNKIP